MSRPAGYRPVVWLRRLLLVVLVAFLGVVVGLLIKGRAPGGDGDEPPTIAADLASGKSEELRTGKGFSHEVTEDGEPRYRISASSWSSTRDELVRLNDVAIRFDRGDGEEYTVEAESGLYQQRTSTATLLGNVRIRNAEGVEIRGPGFELRREGTLIVSTEGPVRFRYQDRFAGTARELSSNLRKKTNAISGSVHIWSLSGESVDASLTARRLVFEQRERAIHAEGGVTLRRDGEELHARRLSIELDQAVKRPQFVRARWEVSGTRPQLEEGVPQTLRFEANRMSVLFDEETGEPLRAELEGRERSPAKLEVADAGGEVRRIETPYLVAEFAGGAIARADILGPVTLTDFLAFDPEQPTVTGCADSAEARFRRSGELASIVLGGGVEFNQATAQVSGDALEARGGEEIVVSGEPARIHSARGEFQALEILYRPEKGTGNASGGVRATLASGGGPGLMRGAGASREPIQVTAASASWSDGGDSVTFRDRVRAWQDENYLSAERLEVGSGGGSLVASGRVKTVIKRAREEGEGEVETSPIEVTANQLDFDGATDILHYTGSPKAHQAGRSLSCVDLEVELDADSEVERMLCSGNALIESPADGQTVRGERALYRPADESVEVSGNPVVLRNADGRQVTGARVVYDFRTGRARVLTSAEPAPAASTAAVEDPGGRSGDPEAGNDGGFEP